VPVPIYEFACGDCGYRFERLQGMADPTPECPSCGGLGSRRLISVVAGLPGSGGASAGGCACGGACACGH
jgi:putative FmdB family regulatory protein